MLRPGRRSLVLALAAAALGLSACGSDEEATIPPENADALLAQLDEVDRAVTEGECTTARTDVSQLAESVNQLPAEAGVETKEALRRLVDNLSGLANDQCEEPDTGATGPEETVAPEESTTTPPVAEATEDTEPAPPEDTEPSEKPEKPEKPKPEKPEKPEHGAPGPGGGSSGGIGGD